MSEFNSGFRKTTGLTEDAESLAARADSNAAHIHRGVASNRPTLSVVIPNYNHGQFFPLLLESIFAQSYQPTEVIVLDDASTDNSLDLLEGFAAKQPTFQFVRNERNMGAVYSFNKVYRMATGDYVFCPAADDLILPGFFEKSMALLAAYPQACLCSSNLVLISEEGKELAVRCKPVIASSGRYFPPEELQKVICQYGPWIDCGSIIARRDCMIQEGCFIEELGSFSDTLVAHVLALRGGACFIPEVLSCWRRIPSGYSSTSVRDWKGLVEKGRLAAHLMRTKYTGLFPERFVRKFENRWRYAVGATRGFRILAETEANLHEVFMAICSSSSFGGHILKTALRLLTRAQVGMWWAFLAVRFGPWGWWCFGRMSIVLNLKHRRFFEKLLART